MKRRLLSVFLAIAMILTLVPSAFADGVGDAVAKIGNVEFSTLQAAVEAVKDGETIVVLKDVEIAADEATNNNAVYYEGDASFTIDFNGKVVTGDTSNVVFRFQKAEGGKENKITFTNGKIISTKNSWSAVSIGSTAETKTFVDLTDMEFEANKGNDFAVRARAGAVFTLTDCTITARYAGGVLAGGGEVTLNNVTVDQKGMHTAPYNSTAAAVHSAGKMTINSGSYTTEPLAASDGNNQGTSHGSWCVNVMNSGGTLIINGGTFANGNFGDDALATYPRECVVLGAAAGKTAEIFINGGTFSSIGALVFNEWNSGKTHTTIVDGKFTAKNLLGGNGGNQGASNISVVGGTSSFEIGEAYFVEGYEYTKDEETGLYGVSVAPDVKMVAQINGGVKYQSLEKALSLAKKGDVISLLDDVVLNSTWVINFGFDVTIDGNGHKITNGGATNTALMVGDTNLMVDNEDAPVYTLKNIVFDGWTLSHVVRVQGVNAVVEGCTFQNCVLPASGLAPLSFNYSYGTVKNCIFKNNTAGFDLIDINSWSDGSQTAVTIEGCEFIDNNCPVVGAIYYHCGSGLEVKDCVFEGNECALAPVFLGIAGENDVVSGCTFTENIGSKSSTIFVEGTATLLDVDDALVGAEAKIGDLYYEYFTNAFAALNEGEVLTLLKEIELAESLVLDGAYAMDGIRPKSPIVLEDGATLTAPEGWDVITAVEGKEVVYRDGVYSLAKLYEIVYTDGVEDAEIFEDQCFILPEGSETPDFYGDARRSGYIFTGWTPVVADIVTGNVTYVATYEVAPKFEDVPADAYFADAITWAAESNIVKGVEEDVFAPEAMASRAQVITFLWRAAGAPKAAADTEVAFTDIEEGSYYYDAVVWAVENGITNGTTATTFSPDAVCTRAQVVTFLWRAAGKPVVDAEMTFTDVEEGTYYYDAVLWAQEDGITNGVAEGIFAPEAECTRAQSITMLYRILG